MSFEPVSGFCIATADQSRSVLLYSRQPAEELTGVAVGACDEPGSSLQLLQVLLQIKHGVQPRGYTAMDDSSDAFLVTDDQALRRRRGVRGFPHRYDLGEEWRQWTGLPFVYSRWYARKGLDPADSLLLEDSLYVGMEDGVQALFDESEPRDDVLMLPKDVSEYIRGFRFFMGLSEYKSVDLFRQYLQQTGARGPVARSGGCGMAKVTERCYEQTGRTAFICDFSPTRSGEPDAVRQAAIDADFISVAYNPGRAVRVNSAMLAAAIKRADWGRRYCVYPWPPAT